jgi:hypothetical protein
VPVDRTLLSSQFDGLGYGCERISDGRNFDFMSSTVETCPDPCSKSCDDDALFNGSGAGEEWIFLEHSGILCPVLPVFFPTCGSRSSDSIVNCSPRKQDITREVSFLGSVNSFQQFFCGNGNFLLKKSVSEISPRKNFPFLKAQDVTSAISLSSPAIGSFGC